MVATSSTSSSGKKSVNTNNNNNVPISFIGEGGGIHHNHHQSAFFTPTGSSSPTSSFKQPVNNNNGMTTATNNNNPSSDFSPRASPEGRSAEGSIATKSSGRREESSSLGSSHHHHLHSYHQQQRVLSGDELISSPPLFELKSPLRTEKGGSGVTTPLPKNPRDTATYEGSITTTATTTVGAGSGAGGSGDNNNILTASSNNNNNTSNNSKLQRRLNKNQQQQQSQHSSIIITGGGSVKSANSWASFGNKSPTAATTSTNTTTGGGGGAARKRLGSNSAQSIGGRSYKSDTNMLLSLPPLKPHRKVGGGGGGSIASLGGGGGGQHYHSHNSSSMGKSPNRGGGRIMTPPPSFHPTAVGGNYNNNNQLSSSLHSSKSGTKQQQQQHTATTTIAPSTISITDNYSTSQSTPTQLDDEEQYMFEQRLLNDELGVAIRKISSSGKAQLRYVKCVTLRPPSSSSDALDNNDGVGVGGGGGETKIVDVNITQHSNDCDGIGNVGSIPGIGTYLDKKNGEAQQSQLSVGGGGGCDVSVSSSVSSRFMGKIKSVVGGRKDKSTTMTLSNDDIDDEDDNNSLLLHQEPSSSLGPHEGGGGGTKTNNNSSSNDNNSSGSTTMNKSLRALTWGKKNAITIPLDRFTCVRKGKTTERTFRNGASASRLLSIVVSSSANNENDGASQQQQQQQQQQESLDIEAPTRLDRDKFASAFARFLGVPLIEEDEYEVEGSNGRVGRSSGGSRRKLRTPSLTRRKKASTLSSNLSAAAFSEPGVRTNSNTARSSASIDATPVVPPPTNVRRPTNNTADTSSLLPALTPNSDEDDADDELAFFNPADQRKQTITAATTGGKVSRENATKTSTTTKSVMSKDANTTAGSSVAMSESARKRISNNDTQNESMLEPQDKTLLLGASPGVAAVDDQGPTINAQKDDQGDDASHVSSLTGGVDQEIVEELHQAIIELRAELDASRAEAARAVKVAEQAIQSAENCSSSDWNSTVTHKAAEAAAQAQKKSAEAIARARMAEERLSAERKSTAFWRRQAQAAEEEAGSLKTKSAGAEVKQAVLMEELASERRKAARMFASLRQEFVNAEKGHVNELNDAQEKGRGLEMELQQVKGELMEKNMELQRIADAERERKAKGPNRMALSFRSSRKSSSGSIAATTPDKSGISRTEDNINHDDVALKERALALESSAQVLRSQCDQILLKSTDEINSLKLQSKEWASQADQAVAASRAETEHLREKLAAESAMRLKLLNELQDIRGTVRVYCRPKPGATKPILSIPTQDILIVNEHSSPVSFKFDRVFSPGTSQYELFSELEEPIVSSLDGFNVALLAFGQQGSGKTFSIMGNCNFDEAGVPSLESHGVQLQALEQLFTIAGHRKGRYKDSFSITMVEVHNEKLFDLVSGASAAESDGRRGKLEIRTNIDGNTVVQGLVSVRVNSFEDVCQLWQESIANRLERLQKQGSDLNTYERNSNVITTIHIQSTNIATGVGTEGKLQFVDMAASDIMPNPLVSSQENRGYADEDLTKFSNKSIDAFNDVVNARGKFDRSVPYRNSTLTHLLRDSLEADTKVLLLCCVSSDEADIDNTMSALRFASRMQSVSIGKATKHIIGSKE